MSSQLELLEKESNTTVKEEYTPTKDLEELKKKSFSELKFAVAYKYRKNIYNDAGEIVHVKTTNALTCNCGHTQDNNGYSNVYDMSCEKCGNKNTVKLGEYGWELMFDGEYSIPLITVVEKTPDSFTAIRTNLKINLVAGRSVNPTKMNLSRVVKFDFIEKELKVWREDKLELDWNHSSFDERVAVSRRLLIGMNPTVFMRAVAVDEDEHYIRNVLTRIYIPDWDNYKVNPILIFGEYMESNRFLQILKNAGFKSLGRFADYRNYWRRHNTAVINKDETKPHKILGVSKIVANNIKDSDMRLVSIKDLDRELSKFDNNKVKDIFSIVKNEGNIDELSMAISNINEIIVDYDYKDVKRLILYLFRDVRLYQGIESPQEASTLLRDLLRMNSAMNLKSEKYPKSLKREHDMANMNYKLVASGADEEMFAHVTSKNSYSMNEYGNDEYGIISPKKPKDLIEEGSSLSHCVGSYAKDIISGRCKIYFLRHIDDLETSLATVEVRNGDIVQARGMRNKSLDVEQNEFINEWAKEKGLNVKYY